VPPSRRSLIAGIALFVLAAAGYAAARETSMFAVRAIEVRDAPPAVRAQVQRALRQERGVSLIRIDGALLDRRLQDVPWVVSSSFDRVFPHTLVVTVRTERPVAVIRSAAKAWLVSARGRVLQPVARTARPGLPRIWARDVRVPPGSKLSDEDGGLAARALAPLAAVHFPARVDGVEAGRQQLTFRLRSGLELRLGDAGDLRVKLAIARRVLGTLGAVSAGDYVDVSVPERPVAFLKSQVGG
jgi:cell division protein FtsQ